MNPHDAPVGELDCLWTNRTVLSFQMGLFRQELFSILDKFFLPRPFFVILDVTVAVLTHRQPVAGVAQKAACPAPHVMNLGGAFQAGGRAGTGRHFTVWPP